MQDRPHGQRISGALDRLVGDVSAVQVREHEHGCLPGHVRARQLLLTDGFHHCGVELQRPVEWQVWVVLLGLLHGGGHGFHVRARTGGASGVAQHRHLRLDTELRGGLRGHGGDLRQLVGGGVRVHGAVAECPQHAVHDHQEDGANHRGTRRGLDDLERGLNGVRGRVSRAGDHTVGDALVDHHRRVVADVLHGLARLLQRDALVLAQLGELGGELLQLVALARVGQSGTGKVQPQLLGAAGDVVRVAQDGQLAHFGAQQLVGGGEDAVVLAFRQHDVRVLFAGLDQQVALEQLGADHGLLRGARPRGIPSPASPRASISPAGCCLRDAFQRDVANRLPFRLDSVRCGGSCGGGGVNKRNTGRLAPRAHQLPGGQLQRRGVGRAAREQVVGGTRGGG